MEADAVIGIAQEGFPAGARLQNAALVFLPQVLCDSATAGDNPDHALGQVDVQIVGHDLPLDIGCGAIEHSFQEDCKVGLAPMVADLAEHLSDRYVEPGDQGLGAVTDILELPPFNGART